MERGNNKIENKESKRLIKPTSRSLKRLTE
jgi:hypothetical protein